MAAEISRAQSYKGSTTTEKVVRTLEELDAKAEELGCRVDSPFSLLSFLALPVVPGLKLTGKGLVDVEMARLLEPAPV